MAARAAVFLDRDGVLNRAPVVDGRPTSPSCVADLEILPGVPEAIVRLRSAGFHLTITTNQPDVARGKQSRARVEAIHAVMAETLGLADIRVCYHDDSDGCDCRKPKPGLIFSAARDAALDLTSSFVVGDRWRDIGAGKGAGCRTIFIDYRYNEPVPFEPDVRVASLLEAAEWILVRALSLTAMTVATADTTSG